MKAWFNSLCPNCGEKISDERLLNASLCEKCLHVSLSSKEEIYQELKKTGKLKALRDYFKLYHEFKKFSEFFKKLVGQEMWSLQKVWAKRVLSKKSFSILAPTGVGKTTFGCITAIYFATLNKKSYMIFPTGLLVEQTYEKISKYLEKINKEIKVIYYHSGLKTKERKEMLQKLENGEFDILITTERFLIKHFNLIKNHKFTFVFVDDVDSFLKSPKNIDKILIALGFDEKLVEKTLELAELTQKQMKLRKPSESIAKEIEELNNYIQKHLPKHKPLLIVSGATPKIRKGKRLFLFQKLLGFQLGSKPEFLRNVEDFYMFSQNLKRDVLNLLLKYGTGCLIFVPMDLGKEFGKELNQFLNENGIKSELYEKMDPELLEKFRRGEYDCLIGVASFRSPIARGIDLPERVRYAIFAGVPKFKIRLSFEEFNPSKLLTIIKNIQEFLQEEDKEKALKLIQNLKKIIPMNKEMIEKIKQAIEENKKLEGFEEYAKNVVAEAHYFLKKVINQELIEKIKASPDIILEFENQESYLIVSDPAAYLQASGRTSRLYAGGLSKGASFLLIDSAKSFNDLKRKTKIYEIEFKEYDEKTVKEIFKKIDEDRRLIKEIAQGKIKPELKSFIKTALLIVESPTKAKTIARFFGRPAIRYINSIPVYEITCGEYVLNIVATMGHCFDLVFTQGYHGVEVTENGIYPIYDFIKKCSSCGEQFTEYSCCPKCGSENIVSKEEIILALREIAQECDIIFLATDPDSEGEKIAWDIACSLKFFNQNIYRLEFHEITRKAILHAIANKREINTHLVEAQIVRRIEDRWIGFNLSQKLWKVFKNHKLSAGRVQTPVLGWIVERTKEYKKKIPKTIIYLENGLKIEAEGDYTNINKVFIETKTEQTKLSPQPPFTTDTLLKEASKFGLSVTQTMQIAQDLFECGLITYHRTDSTTVSTTGIAIAKEYIEKHYSQCFKARTWFKPGAHECIRPTKPWSASELRDNIAQGLITLQKPLTRAHFLIYNLIFTRFIASQMKEVIAEKQILKFKFNSTEIQSERIIKIIEDGFNLVIPIKTQDPVNQGEYFVEKTEKRLVPKAYLFTQGEIISLMKEKNIGRPSTYAKIVSVLFLRKYILEKKGRVFSTSLGVKVYSFLSEHYGKYISEELTRKLEMEMDEIENGRKNYQDVLKEVYKEVKEIERT